MKLDLTFIKVKLEALFMKTPSIAEADLRLLKVFRTVVSCGGFAGAQAELNVGLSTITIHMQTLEQRLGCKLCTRGRSGFQLTDQGRAVYSATERLFSALETFRLDVYDSSAGVSGEIRVAMIDNLITHPECRLDDAFARFRGRGARCKLFVEMLRAADIEAQVANGSFDVGIGLFPKIPAGLSSVSLFEETHCLYCGKDHPCFNDPDIDTIDIEAITQFDYVDRGILEYASVNPPLRFAVSGARASSVEAIAILIRSGHFIGYLPDHFAQYWVEAGALRAIGQRALSHVAPITAIFFGKRIKTRVIEAFLDDLFLSHNIMHQTVDGAITRSL
jgi:LysR family transcriptional regulator, transcriptional activator for bauABCD operon